MDTPQEEGEARGVSNRSEFFRLIALEQLRAVARAGAAGLDGAGGEAARAGVGLGGGGGHAEERVRMPLLALALHQEVRSRPPARRPPRR